VEAATHLAASARHRRRDGVAGHLGVLWIAVLLSTLAFVVDDRRLAPMFMGRIPIPWSVGTAVIMLAVLAQPVGDREPRGGRWNPPGPYARMTLGSPSDWAGFYAVMGTLLGVAAVVYHHCVGSWVEPLALLANAISEETTFRYALPVLAAATLVGARGPSRAVMPCAVGVSALLFATMPGHVQQMHGRLDIAPFLAFAVLMSMVSLRTGALLPAMLAHTLINVCTLPVNLNVAPPTLRLGGVVVALVGLVIASRHAAHQQEARAEFAARLASIEPTYMTARQRVVVDLDFEERAAAILNGDAPRASSAAWSQPSWRPGLFVMPTG
jgi:hypothetical protein